MEIDSRHMADECRSGKSKKPSGEADDFGRGHGVSERRQAYYLLRNLLDMRRARVDIRIDKDDIPCSRDFFGKLRQELLGAKKGGAGSGFEQIQDAMRHAVVTSQGIANGDQQGPHR